MPPPSPSSFDWRKSTAHLSLLTSFLSARPVNIFPPGEPWQQVLGEPPEQAVEHMLKDKALVICSTYQTLALGLPNLKVSELRELLRELKLDTNGSKGELVERLALTNDPVLLLAIPRPYRYFLQCTDLGRQLAEEFLANGADVLKHETPEVAEAVVKTLKWLIKEGVILGVVSGAAYDFMKSIMSSEGLLQAVSTSAIPKPSPVPAPFDSTPQPPATSQPQRLPSRRTTRFIEPEMVFIPAGEFWMGSENQPDIPWLDERPMHRVYLTDFWMGVYPVTVSEYAAFVKDTSYKTTAEKFGDEHHWQNPYTLSGLPSARRSNHPVRHISWEDAMAYCNWLADLTSRPYTLPSEAEWEKAARGTDQRLFPWGSQPPDARLCNFNDNNNDTTAVGSYSPLGDSPYHCADMAGNVQEWTRSIFKDYPYDPKDGREDLNSDGVRVLRGGSFNDGERRVRCACRGYVNPGDMRGYSGFRVCVSHVP